MGINSPLLIWSRVVLHYSALNESVSIAENSDWLLSSWCSVLLCGNVRSREYGLLSTAGIFYFLLEWKIWAFCSFLFILVVVVQCMKKGYCTTICCTKLTKLTLHDHAMGFSLILQYIMHKFMSIKENHVHEKSYYSNLLQQSWAINTE